MIEYRTRKKFLNALPKGARCAEVGVSGGSNALDIVQICRPRRLYLIDCWEQFSDKPCVQRQDRNNEKLDAIYENVKSKFSVYRNVNIVRKYSLDGMSIFADKSMDWIYLDASHQYEDILQDMRMAQHKIKSGGVLCGHDYVKEGKNKGVYKAVNEFLKDNNFELHATSACKDKDWSIILP